MGDHRKYFAQVMFLDNFTCVYCGKRSPDLAIDHYIPQSQGGPDCLQNLVACCKWCNSSKRDRAVYDWGVLPHYGRFEKFYTGQIVTKKVPVMVPVLLTRVRTWKDNIDGMIIFGVVTLVMFATSLFAYAIDAFFTLDVSVICYMIFMLWMFARLGLEVARRKWPQYFRKEGR